MNSKTSEIDRIKAKYFNDLKSDSYIISYLFMEFKEKNDLKELNKYKSDTNADEYDTRYVRAVTNRIKMEIISVLTDKGKHFPQINPLENCETCFEVISEDIKIQVKVNEDKNIEEDYIWEVEIKGEFFVLEEYRNKILTKMLRCFEKKYCLIDDVSHEISLKAYPMLNKLENKLREYLLRFFIKKVGKNWWKKNTNSALQKKSLERKEGRDYVSILDMEIYSLDFKDLLELIVSNFEQLDNHNIVQTIEGIIRAKEDPELVELKASKLREKFESNWTKFFEKYITIEKFSQKWSRLYDIRCIVCHNSLIKLKTFIELTELYDVVFNNLEEIICAMGKESLSITEKTVILKEKKSSEYIEKIKNLKDMFLSKSDIQCIINRKSFILTKKNITCTINDNEFKDFVESNISQLEIISKIKNHEFQCEMDDENEETISEQEDDICIIYFEDIPTENMNSLKAEVETFGEYYLV